MSACVICSAETARGYLCGNHFERLATILRDVEFEATMLDARPSLAIRTGSGGGSLASQRTPARLDVLVHTDHRSRPAGTRPPGPSCPTCWHHTCTDIRAWIDAYDARATDTLSILDVLHSWARVVREERDLAQPDAVTVTGERDLLTRQLDWLADQPYIDEVFADLRQLLGQLKAVNGTTDEKPVGRCYLPAEDGACNGPIWIDEAHGNAHCARCRQTWTGQQLAYLKWELDEAKRPHTDDGRPMLTAQELVARGKVSSVSNVRVIAHRRGSLSVHGYYDPAVFDAPTANHVA